MKKLLSISDAKLAANRANAKKSTGPRTAAGKAASSQNAITHCLTAKDTTILGEDYTDFVNRRDSFIASLQPRNALEASLIERLAKLEHRLNRCTRQETGLFDLHIADVTPNNTPETIQSAQAMSFVKMESSFMNLSRYEAAFARHLPQQNEANSC